MTTPEGNKPESGADFESDPQIPPEFMAMFRRTQDQLSRSAAWPIVPQDHASIAQGLRERGELHVLVYGRRDWQGQPDLGRQATLTMRNSADGAIEFELNFVEAPPDDVEPFALCAGQLDIWDFGRLRLGELPDVVPQENGAGPTIDADAPLALAAAGALHGRGAPPQEFVASNDRVELNWQSRLLTITIDRPPLASGQPVIIETRRLEDDGELHTELRAVSIESPITAGPNAGRFVGSMECYIPADPARFQIEARPLTASDLHLLDAGELRGLLASQKFPAICIRPPGLRFIVRPELQRSAVGNVKSAWFLRVALGKEASV